MVVVGAGIGLFQGFISTRFGIPTFVVTLAGLLGWQGLQLKVLGETGTVNLEPGLLTDLAGKFLADSTGWIIAIVCVGETRAEREAGRAVEVVAGQIAGSLPGGATADKLVIAYEPVWAIGTGLTPTTADIVEIHTAIRGRIPAGTRILYGGSVNPKNAAEILALPEVDGALVGGASLKPDDFWSIATAAR